MTLKVAPARIARPQSKSPGSPTGQADVQKSSKVKIQGLTIESSFAQGGAQNTTFGSSDLKMSPSQNSSYARLRKPSKGLGNSEPESNLMSATRASADSAKIVTNLETAVTSVLNKKYGTTNISDLTRQLTDACGGDTGKAAAAFNRYVGMLGKGLTPVEFGLNYKDSQAQTAAGKFHEALAKFGIDAGQAAIIAKSGNPYLAVAALAESCLPKKMQAVSGTLSGSGSLWGSLVDAVESGNSKALDAWHEKNLSGEHGPIMKAAAEAGAWWAKRGITGGFSEFADAFDD